MVRRQMLFVLGLLEGGSMGVVVPLKVVVELRFLVVLGTNFVMTLDLSLHRRGFRLS